MYIATRHAHLEAREAGFLVMYILMLKKPNTYLENQIQQRATEQ